MGNVIMPGTRTSDGKARVWMPPGATKALMGDTISVCEVPTFFDPETGELKKCGARFIVGQERRMERHHADCAVAHEDVIRTFLGTRHPEIMDPQDKEYAEWMSANMAGIMRGDVKW